MKSGTSFQNAKTTILIHCKKYDPFKKSLQIYNLKKAITKRVKSIENDKNTDCKILSYKRNPKNTINPIPRCL